jgi:hypothetical protein
MDWVALVAWASRRRCRAQGRAKQIAMGMAACAVCKIGFDPLTSPLTLVKLGLQVSTQMWRVLICSLFA